MERPGYEAKDSTPCDLAIHRQIFQVCSQEIQLYLGNYYHQIHSPYFAKLLIRLASCQSLWIRSTE